MVLLFSCSLNPESRSRVLAEAMRERLGTLGEPVQYVDLRDVPLPMCDGAATYGDPNARRLAELGKQADAIVLAAPVYNYGVSAATKNLVELTGRSWTGKVVGMLLAAGGQGSYMAAMSLANSLMLDFRCLIIPRFVYADGDAFDEERITDAEVDRRVAELAREVVRVSRALRSTDPGLATSPQRQG
jgi:NAD(P)H-dependent FMN reductase